MRKWIAMALLCLLPLIVNGQKIKDGFKGFEWGTPYYEMDSVFEFGDPFEVNMYLVYMTDIDSLGGAKVLCAFTFYKDRFAGVAIITQGLSDWTKLLRVLEAAYGEPDKPNPYIEEYEWNSRYTQRTYEYNRFSEQGSLSMISWDIFKESEKDREKEAEKAKDEF